MRILKRNKKLIVDDKEITDQANILEYIRELYKFVLTKPEKKNLSEIKSILSHISTIKNSLKIKIHFEKDLNKKYLSIL